MRAGLFNPNYLHMDHEGRQLDAAGTTDAAAG